MASKRKTGDPASLTVEILQDIRSDLKDVRADLAGLRRDTNARFESLERSTADRFESLERSTADRFESLERATIRGFEAVTARLENLRDFAGERWRDHEDRITRLEGHAGLVRP